MKSVFIAPHNDDEVLFGAFTLLRHKPLVIVCFYESLNRAAETKAALDILGCNCVQWPYHEAEMEWVLRDVADLDFEHVFAPASEWEGNPDHNAIGDEAAKTYPGRLTRYLTYTSHGKSTGGAPVTFEPDWIALKLRALACYRSQHEAPGRVAHFLRDQREFYKMEADGPW